MSETRRDRVKLTGLWEKKTRDGKTYFSGSLTHNSQIAIWPNQYKSKTNDPDYILFIESKVMEPRQASSTPQQKPTTVIPAQPQFMDESDIPF